MSATINREKIRRVLHNLLNNAIKFSPHSSKIHLQAFKTENNHIVIKISDNGIGIPKEHLNSIFDLDHKTQREGTSGEKSYGLGLYICKLIVEEHEGSIIAENNEGSGTIFTITLPS